MKRNIALPCLFVLLFVMPTLESRADPEGALTKQFLESLRRNYTMDAVWFDKIVQLIRWMPCRWAALIMIS